MTILHRAKDYVENLFKDKLSSVYFYHNFIHTTFTVNKAEEILRNTEVPEEDQEKVLLALWFHDTGYIECAKEHEDKYSAKKVHLSIRFSRTWIQLQCSCFLS